MLFEVALVQQPTKKEQEEGQMEKLIMPPTPVIARDDQSAAVAAVLQAKEKIECDMSRIQVLVRPFAPQKP